MTWLEWLDVAVKIFSIAALALLGAGLAYQSSLAYRNRRIMNNMIVSFEGMLTASENMTKAFMSQQEAFGHLTGWIVPVEEWAGVVELHQQLQDKGSELGDYLIYCHMHSGYWSANNQGYTPDRKAAKRFTAPEGLILVLDRARNGDPYDCYTLIRVSKEDD